MPRATHIDRGIFDVRRSYRGLSADFGLFRHQLAQSRSAEEGWEVRVGSVITAVPDGFYLAGRTLTVFRGFDSKSFSLSILQPDVEVGVRLGPAEIGGGVALSLLTIDVFRGDWSGQLFTPRAHAAVGLRLGSLRVEARGYTEYYWRWYGEDRRIRGLTFGVSFESLPLAP